MKTHPVTYPLLLVLLAIQPAAWGEPSAAAEPLSLPDTVIYVADSNASGVYRPLRGEVRQLHCKDLVIAIEGSEALYQRAAVYRVEWPDALPDELAGVVNQCWSDESETGSALAAALKHLEDEEYASALLSLVGGLKLPAQIIIAVLILIGLAVKLAYSAYEKFVISNHIRDLNISKLTMEVRKLRHELESLGITLEPAMVTATDAADPDSADRFQAPFEFDLPEIHFVGFIDYTILNKPTAGERQQITEKWAARWGQWLDRPAPLASAFFFASASVLYLAVLFLGVCSVWSGLMAVFAIAYPQDFGGFLSMLIFAALALLFLRICVRFAAKASIMRATHREAFSNRAPG